MKRILFSLFLFFLLFWAVLWAQTNANSTARFQVDSLLQEKKYTAAAALIYKQPQSDRDTLWKDFETATLDSAYIQDSALLGIAILDTAIFQLQRTSRADSIARFWRLKAHYHKTLEQFFEAIEAYLMAIRIYEKNGETGSDLALCYNRVAQIYIRRNDYDKADEYLKSSIEVDTAKEYWLSSYSQLANNAYWRDSFDLGLYYFEAGKKCRGEESSLAALRSAGANILIKKGRLQEARTLIQQALEFYQKEENQHHIIRCFTGLAYIAERMGKMTEAEQFYLIARQTANIFAQRYQKSRELAKFYCEWGDFLSRQGRTKEAIHLYQQALVQAYPDFEDLDPAVNPKPAIVPTETWAMYAPARKASLLLLNPTPQNRALAADCFSLAFAAAERLRLTYGAANTKIYFAQSTYDLKREAALNLWAMYREKGDAANLNRLFDLLEQNRANALRDALLEQKAMVSTGIPDSLLRIEDGMRREIASTQNSLAEADTAIIKQLQSYIDSLDRRHEDLLRILKNKYPRYREYLEAGQTANLDWIRTALPPKAALLTFFDAGDRYLCLTLRHIGSISAYEVPRDSVFDTTFARFQALLSDKTGQESNPAAFFDAAYFLKQRLLPSEVLKNSEALIIVPDGRLSYLPFEALLTAPHKGAYGKAPYLLRSHTVQYAWSAALLAEKPVQSLPGKPLLHVAPFPSVARDGLAALPNSLNEKPEDAVADHLQGDQARADTFLRDAAAYDVLHLSTHAHAGQREKPGIEFVDRTVSLPEIYAQRLNASLVVLSACETNAGEFAEGEGVMSLARAFAYAGARSLVASYWSVNDRSTANLFSAFYRHLQDGLSKSEALRQAKLDLLDEAGADARKAPYHWAAFTLSGSDGPVALPKDGWPWWAWALG
ncbi:MAG: CHAT domain-containing tetratricopeptide repeat protein, partial [Saprospiraceae bacterium]